MADEHNPEGFGHEEEHLTELQVMVREEVAKAFEATLPTHVFEFLFAIREGPRELRAPDFFAVREDIFSPPSRYRIIQIESGIVSASSDRRISTRNPSKG
ncbi:hypothetical protein E3N88_37680 [Mikania micrantha]|uniref:Uncharacterized protein n=1 Tax=Mikania micrantha TaxID=192012 RepID=A0A5N6LRV4_9ASTR|nr:hypothetical protein E3N88_37680 [Mikania micrantha]